MIINDATNDKALRFRATGNAFYIEATNNAESAYANLVLEGNVGIGTSLPTKTLDINTASATFRIRDATAGNDFAFKTTAGPVSVIGCEANTSLALMTNNTERMRLDSSGNVGIGTSSIDARLRVTSGGNSVASNAVKVVNSSSTELLFIRDDGAFRTGTASVSPYNNTAAVSANLFVNTDGTLVRATSSLRYKKEIADATFGLSDVLKLRPVTYKGNNSEVDQNTVYGGLIAEEVHDAGLTEFVEYNEQNQPDALRYQHMVSLCIKAIQEQQQQIETLKTQTADLEARVATLEGN
jgi:hypothetical protein